jgi:hypothetical protein
MTILTGHDGDLDDVLAETEALFKEAKRRERRRRLIVSSVVAAALIAGATLLAVTGGGAGSPARAGGAAPSSGAPDSGVKPPAYYYTETEVQTEVSSGSLVQGGPTVSEYFLGTVQTWVAPNGSGRRVKTTNQIVHFFTAAGRKAWVAAGKPPILGPPDPERTVQTFGPHYAFTVNPTIRIFDISQLPTATEPLTQLIERGNITVKGVRQTPLKGLGGATCSTHVCLTFERAATLLQSPDIGSNAARRMALFEVMAHLPGVRTLSRASDPLSRQGVGLRLVQHHPASTVTYECQGPNGSTTSRGSFREPASSTIEEAIFDPRTSTLLSNSTSYSPEYAPVQNPCSGIPEGTRTGVILPNWTLLLHSGTTGSDSKTPS